MDMALECRAQPLSEKGDAIYKNGDEILFYNGHTYSSADGVSSFSVIESPDIPEKSGPLVYAKLKYFNDDQIVIIGSEVVSPFAEKKYLHGELKDFKMTGRQHTTFNRGDRIKDYPRYLTIGGKEFYLHCRLGQ